MLGVDFVTNTKVGRDVTIDELFDRGFDAVYLGTGPGVDRELRIPGASDLQGVVTVTEFLMRANASSAKLLAESGVHTSPGANGIAARPPGPRVVVIGGGDPAMDCVRAALRLGASAVTLVFSGRSTDLHARAEEGEDARAEGVAFRFESEPVAFLGDRAGRLAAVRCRRLEYGEPSRGGRRRAFAVQGSEFEIPATLGVIAIGYDADPLVRDAAALLPDGHAGAVRAGGDSGRTSRPGLFAGGDVVYGEGLVVTAMAAGRRVAAAIDGYLRSLDSLPPAPLLDTVNGHARRRRFGLRGRTGVDTARSSNEP
jgi:glutamate synthase (NADPH/NADH) small chain